MNQRPDARRLLRTIVRAIGVGGVGTFAGSACGGNVVVDENADVGTSGVGGGSGGGRSGATNATVGVGGGDVTTGVGSTGAGGSSTCDVRVPLGSEKQAACVDAFQSGVCPDKDEPSITLAMMEALSGLGCGGFDVQDVVCGPEPLGSACCYTAIGVVLECGGRPFLVRGSATTAGLASGDGWFELRTRPDLSDLSAELRESLAEAWVEDALDEHASIASFARFILELLSAGAPADLVGRAERALRDEIRHAELCFGLASAYAGRSLCPGPLALDAGSEPRKTLAAIAAAVVREGCVGETIAALGALRARDAATDGAVRAALETIAADEVIHAQLSWRFAAWALVRGDDDVRRAVGRAFADALEAPVRLREDEHADAIAARAHGRLPADERRDVALEALDLVVRPAAAALLGSASCRAR